VETTTGEPYAYTSATTVRVYNPSLPPGTEIAVQSGGISGFTVGYTRKVFRHDKLIRDEEFVVRYLPENTIIEYGPEPPPSPPASDGGESSTPSDETGSDDDVVAGAGAGDSSSEPPEESGS
jgi:hypothetical protein